jgi:hypothetical protein
MSPKLTFVKKVFGLGKKDKATGSTDIVSIRINTRMHALLPTDN